MHKTTPHVFTPTYNRPDLLRVCLPRLAESCRNAGARLVAVDDCSDDPRVLPLLRRHADEVIVSERRLMTEDWWGPRRRIAWIAHSRGLDRYLKVDDDVLVGPAAVELWLAAADALPPERRGLLAAVAKRAPWADCPQPFCHGNWTYRERPATGDLLWHDCARMVWLNGCQVSADEVTRQVKYRPRSCGQALGIAYPQLEIQHLGLGCTVSHYWDGKGGGTFRQRPCASGLTGERVEVEGFDLDLWLACTRIGPEAVRAFADGRPPARAYRLACGTAPVRVLRGRDAAYLMREIAANREKRRRSLILWTGLWQGDRTRKALGVMADDHLTRVCPDGHRHPWLKKA